MFLIYFSAKSFLLTVVKNNSLSYLKSVSSMSLINLLACHLNINLDIETYMIFLPLNKYVILCLDL